MLSKKGGNKMNRNELGKYIQETFKEEILTKFVEKNKSYGSDKESAFYNFNQTGLRLCTNPNINLNELDKRLLPLFTYMDKHNVALMQNLGNTAEFRERVIDNIVYSFIALALQEEWGVENEREQGKDVLDTRG